MSKREIVREALAKSRKMMGQDRIRELAEVPADHDNVIYVNAWGLYPKPHKFYTDGSPKLNTMEVDRRANNERIIRDLKNNNNREA